MNLWMDLMMIYSKNLHSTKSSNWEEKYKTKNKAI